MSQQDLLGYFIDSAEVFGLAVDELLKKFNYHSPGIHKCHLMFGIGYNRKGLGATLRVSRGLVLPVPITRVK